MRHLQRWSFLVALVVILGWLTRDSPRHPITAVTFEVWYDYDARLTERLILRPNGLSSYYRSHTGRSQNGDAAMEGSFSGEFYEYWLLADWLDAQPLDAIRGRMDLDIVGGPSRAVLTIARGEVRQTIEEFVYPFPDKFFGIAAAVQDAASSIDWRPGVQFVPRLLPKPELAVDISPDLDLSAPHWASTRCSRDRAILSWIFARR